MQLEDETGLTRSSITKWQNSYASWDKLLKVADYFEVSIDSLLGRHKMGSKEIHPSVRSLVDFLFSLHLKEQTMCEIVSIIKDLVSRIIRLSL